MWKFDAVRDNGPAWVNVTTPAGGLWQVGVRRWAWKRGTWPAPERPLFRFWLVGWLEFRRYI